MTNASTTRRLRTSIGGVALFILIAVIGLLYVKWSPYYERAFVAAQTHSIGNSILADADGTLPAPSLHAALDYAIAYGLAIWKALLLGLLLGSGLNALLPPQWVGRWLGGRGARSVLVGSLLSVPSMMCTCCSAPVVTGLRQCRAAPGSTVAYWLGNTMLNPATLVFMGFVLGWHWVGLRLVMGLVMVLGMGWLINRLDASRPPVPAALIAPSNVPEENGYAPGLAAALQRWGQSFIRMVLRLLPEYLILVLLLGATRAWLFPAIDVDTGNSLIWILGAAVAGMLFVIPTAGEVPIVQAMLALGMASGPAAALLMTLPPISLPSLAMVARAFRGRELVILMAGVVTVGVLSAGLAIWMGF